MAIVPQQVQFSSTVRGLVASHCGCLSHLLAKLCIGKPWKWQRTWPFLSYSLSETFFMLTDHCIRMWFRIKCIFATGFCRKVGFFFFLCLKLCLPELFDLLILPHTVAHVAHTVDDYCSCSWLKQSRLTICLHIGATKMKTKKTTSKLAAKHCS